MKPVVKTNIVLLLTALFIAGCSGAPQPQENREIQQTHRDLMQSRHRTNCLEKQAGKELFSARNSFLDERNQ